MRLAARAWTLREAARIALPAGDTATARALARTAYDLERTPRARRLLALALVASGDAARAREVIAEESHLLVPPRHGRGGANHG
jgi:uncharacterized membrane-anchored protein